MRANADVGGSCCCNSPTCFAIGYGSLFRVPTDDGLRREWEAAGGLTRGSLGSAKFFRYWHFLPKHRRRGVGGQWELIRGAGAWTDNEGKSWSGPVPIAKLADFVDTCRSQRMAPLPRIPITPAGANADALARTVVQRDSAIAAEEQRNQRSAADPARPAAARPEAAQLRVDQSQDAVRLAQQVAELQALLESKDSTLNDYKQTIERLQSENGSLLQQTQEQALEIQTLLEQQAASIAKAMIDSAKGALSGASRNLRQRTR